MKRYIHLIIIFALTFMMSGCWLYKPQLADVPLIEHKGDVRVAGSVYLFPATGATATISAGLTNRMALQLHTDYESRDVHYSHASLGLYRSLGKRVREGYLGIGYGNGDVYIDASPASAHGPYFCGFGQFNYGWHLSEHSDIGFSMKVGRMFSYFRGSYKEYNDLYGDDPFGPRWSTLLEPQVFFRVGGECVKFQTQLGYTHMFLWPKANVMRYIPLSFSVGVNISL